MKKITIYKRVLAVLLCLSFSVILTSCSESNQSNVDKDNPIVQEVITSDYSIDIDALLDNKLIEVDGGNLSGYRESNVKVDIGFGDREYYAYTNEYSQLVYVTAEEIILQDDDTEPVLDSGRYYYDEANVKGVESDILDQGHVIADSLGGVSNAYNITPQNYILNRHGDQAYMEKNIRDAKGATDFVAIITYPNNETQIPSHYSMYYTINGEAIHDEFDNESADDTIDDQIDPHDTTQLLDQSSGVLIVALDKNEEYIVIRNSGEKAINLQGWTILSVLGSQTFIFDDYLLNVGDEVKIGDSEKTEVDLYWLDGRGTWNNSKSDRAELYNDDNVLVDVFNN